MLHNTLDYVYLYACCFFFEVCQYFQAGLKNEYVQSQYMAVMFI